MASGALGKASLSAAADTLLYSVPNSGVVAATVNIRVANRNNADARIRVAVGTGASPANEDYINYDAIVPAFGFMEETGVVCSPGEKVWVRSDTANVSARVHGFEEVI